MFGNATWETCYQETFRHSSFGQSVHTQSRGGTPLEPTHFPLGGHIEYSNQRHPAVRAGRALLGGERDRGAVPAREPRHLPGVADLLPAAVGRGAAPFYFFIDGTNGHLVDLAK